MSLFGRGRIVDVSIEHDTRQDSFWGRASERVDVETKLVIKIELRSWNGNPRDLIAAGPYDVEIAPGSVRLNRQDYYDGTALAQETIRRLGETDEQLRARLLPQPQPPSGPEERTLAVLPEGVVTHNPEPPTKEEVERPDSRFAWLEVD